VVGIGRAPVEPGPARGDIHFIAFPEIGGHVMRGPHPAIVVQSDRLRRSATTMVVPMTSTSRAAEFSPPYLVPVTSRESGLDRDGWVKCDQIRTFPIEALGQRVARLSPGALERVEAAIRFALDL
jgi:mRNA-degrading endonuclease toxin of MazEF toxin-antitoxin module